VKIVVVFALWSVLAMVGLALAQTPASPSTSPATKAEQRKASTRTVNGVVKSSSADTVVVSGRDKGKDMEWTFAVELTTDIRKRGKSVIPEDLKPGDAVQVRFTEQDGKALARSIQVKGGGTATKKSKS
jgi:Cu/Ag efflux protein CusF